MTEIPTDTAGRRWPAVALTIGSLAWLAAVAVMTTAALPALRNADPLQFATVIGALALQALPPLTLLVIAFVWLRRTRPATSAMLATVIARHTTAREASDALARDAVALDDMLDRIAERFKVLRQTFADDIAVLDGGVTRLDSGVTRLAEAAGLTRGAGDALAAILPDAVERVDRLRATLDTTGDETTRQLAEVETMLAAVWNASDDATRRHDGAASAATARLVALSTAADEVAQRLAAQGAAVQTAVAAAFDGTAAALARTRDGVEMQTVALSTSIEKARAGIDGIGSDALRGVEDRLGEVLAAAAALSDQLTAQEAQSRAFADGATRSFGVLDARLANAAAATGTTLDGLATRLGGVYEALDKVAAPIGAASGAVGDIEAAMARLNDASTAAMTRLGSDLPATGDGIAQLTEGVAGLRTALDALDAPLAAGNGTARSIAAQLADALGTASAVETATGSAALTASTDLIEVLARVREVAAVTAGTMRATLADVVTEAEAALNEAGTTRARTAFGDPVAAEIAAVQAAADDAAKAAQTAAERVTQRLLALTSTIATVEARIDEVDTRYDVALRDDLAKRSQGLIESLQAGAIDLTKLLGMEVGDEAWGAYLKGDRGVFARRAVRLLDRDTARRIARHFEHDLPFREQAVRYITEFETLLQRVMPVREGKALSTTLLSSDVGKLYVGLAQATEGLR